MSFLQNISFFKKKNVTKTLTLLLVGILLSWVFYITGCQDVLFSSMQVKDCEELSGLAGCAEDEVITGRVYEPGYFDPPPSTTTGTGTGTGTGTTGMTGNAPADTSAPFTPADFAKVEKVPMNLLDIIFVIDNSNSMTEELASIANQFDSFLNRIRDMDYHIAIITMDVQSDRGEFLYFPNGERFLSQSTGNHRRNISYFQQTIQRTPGTNDDERGIYALNMALDHSAHSSFFRKHSMLMAVIISDEDERSWGGVTPPDVDLGRAPPLESYDEPEVFFQKVRQQNELYGVAVHSIIVKPGDNSCQSQSGGVPGTIYAQASHPSAGVLARYGHVQRGEIASICSTNYGSQLGAIANYALEARPIQLHCVPDSNRMRVRVNGEAVDYRVSGSTVQITDRVNLNSTAKVVYRCQ